MAETKTMNVRFQQKYDTAANWAESTIILLAGEMAIESDTGKFKFGNGEKKFSELDYAGIDQAQLDAIEDNYYKVVPTIPEGAEEIETDSQALARVVTNPKKGDVAVCERAIGDDTEASASTMTDYMYDGEHWCALDGNYDASNVYFAKDFTLAGSYTAVGNVTKSSNAATGTLSAKGKSLEQLIQNIFTKELNPSNDLPTIALSGDSDQSGEVGTTFSLPTVKVTVSDVGSYTYGPATGINFPIGDLVIAECASSSDKATITSASNKKSNTTAAVKDSSVSLTASNAKGTVYTDSAISFTFDAVGSYTQGAMPVTNLGNDYESKRIAAGDAHCDARTIKRTGWRNYWYGFVSTTDAAGLTRITDSTASNYNKVTDGKTTLIAGGSAISNKTLPTIAAVAGDRMPVVVFPTSAKKKVASATMPGSLNSSVDFTFIKTVSLAGANGASAVSYDVWGYVADEMPVGADFSIVIGNK